MNKSNQGTIITAKELSFLLNLEQINNEVLDMLNEVAGENE